MVAEDCKPFDHVMVDIETMSLDKHNALILSVGLVEFDPEPISGPRFGAQMLIVPHVMRQLSTRSVSPSTQKFWREQSPAARAHWENYSGERTSLENTCSSIRSFCMSASRVWANGNQFDLANLEGLNAQLGGAELWHYQKPRDMRTFCRETPATRLVPIGDALDIEGVPHEPIYDCMVQAWQVWAHWSQS